MAEAQKIFFSYSRVDGEKFALKLANDLRKAGCNIWIDQLDIRPGKPWDIEIEKALETATCVLFIATEKSTNSNNVLDEVYYALDKNKEVIPVIFESCQIPFRLKRLQHIDFTANYDAAFNRLAEALKAENQTATFQSQPVDYKKDETNVIHPGTEKKNFVQQSLLSESSSIANSGKSKKTMRVAGICIGLAIVLVILYFIIPQKKIEDSTDKSIANTDTALKEKDSSQLVKTEPGKKEIDQVTSKVNEKNDTGNTTNVSSVNEPVSAYKTAGKNVNADTNYYRLQLKNGGQYLDAAYCGTKVTLNANSDYADGACQLWRLVPAGDGWSGLQLKNGGQYLSADNCSDNLILKPASEFDANDGCQLWRFVAVGNGWNRLQLRYEEKYMDADHCSKNILLGPGSNYADGACQLWQFVH